MTVTVFTKPHCPQCDATKRQLTKLGVPFETVDLTQNPSTLEQLQAAGVPAELVRMSCGLESSEDLIADIAQALDKI